MYKKTIITVFLALVMAPLGMEAKKKAKTVQEKFQFTGIPFIVIYDKDGNRCEDKTVEQLLEKMK